MAVKHRRDTCALASLLRAFRAIAAMALRILRSFRSGLVGDPTTESGRRKCKTVYGAWWGLVGPDWDLKMSGRNYPASKVSV